MSLVRAVRCRGFEKVDVHEVARAGVRRYREMTNTYAGMRTFDVWSSHITRSPVDILGDGLGVAFDFRGEVLQATPVLQRVHRAHTAPVQRRVG